LPAVCLSLLLGAALAVLAGAALAQQAPFDHLRTGFPLTGAHQSARCDSCHQRGVFKGTPRQCAVCHTRVSGISAVVMPRDHVRVTQGCEVCHNTSTFTGARFRHMGVAPGTCATCHNGSTAQAKPGNHVMTSASCDACHRTTAWIPAAFNHANVVPGSCATCHNGSRARGKPANHLVTVAACDSCHRTTAWVPATFSHATVAPGSCATCHNGSGATGKPANHFVTTRACDACHTSTAWLPLRRYTHLSPFYKQHNAGVVCLSCHKSNTEAATWTFATYKPDCAGCHAGRFKPDPHKKVDSPAIFYTVSELRDCSGSCHMYRDATFSVIVKSRSGQHRPTDGGF
jgi:hypothetical protein